MNGGPDSMSQATLPGFDPDKARNREWYQGKLKQKLFDELPAQAKVEGWPIVLDHCIARAVYDCACGDVWYDAVDGRPFINNASYKQIQDAVGIALRMEADGVDYVARRNEQSLLYRGEIEPEDAKHYYGV